MSAETKGMSTCDGHEGGLAAGSPGQCVDVLPRTDGRLPNGTFTTGNRCSLQHGKRSAGAVLKRKQGAAARKAAAWVMVQLDALHGSRCRLRRLREDQLRHFDREGLAMLARLGVPGACGRRSRWDGSSR